MTNARGAILVLTALTLLAGPAGADDKGIHIPKGRSNGWIWYLTDGAGFRWDINPNGSVNDGTNDAYDGGMRLQVNGSYFSGSGQGTLSKDGRETEAGPWRRGEVSVYRRIYVDAKLGYCRWIDIFENTSSSAQTLTLRYHSNLGGQVSVMHTTTGKAAVTDKDWGVVTGYSSSRSSRPVLVHVFGARGAKDKPRFESRPNGDDLYYHMSLKVPARRTVALCFFEAQRSGITAGKKFLKDFSPREELKKVPPALRRIIVNMSGATFTLGSLELRRHEKHDLAVLRNGDELLGTILNEKFVVETFYGRLDLPAARVIGISIPSAHEANVQVALADAQVVAGKLLNAPLRFKLTSGDEMSLPMAKLKTASFVPSPSRPEDVAVSRPTIVLRSGQQLFFRLSDLKLAFHSEHGDLQLGPDDVRAIHFDTPGGGLHRVVFRNGGVLSGLLDADRLEVKLDLGPTLDIPRHLALRLLLPSSPWEDAPEATVTLRNENVLHGRIVDEKLLVLTGSGKVEVVPETIAGITFQGGAVALVTINLRNGATVSGKLAAGTIEFQVEPGPKLPIFVGHIVEIACLAPDVKATTQPASAPRPGAFRGLAHPATRRIRPVMRREAELAKKLAECDAQLAVLAKKAKALAAKNDAASKKALAEIAAESAKLKALREALRRAAQRP